MLCRRNRDVWITINEAIAAEWRAFVLGLFLGALGMFVFLC